MIDVTDPVSLRRYAYALLIVVAVAGVVGRIAGVSRVYEPYLCRPPGVENDPRGRWPVQRPEPLPTHADNDRSRWGTVRALVEEGTYAIGRRPLVVSLASSALALGGDNAIQAAALFTAGYQARTKSDVGIVTQSGWTTIDKVLDPRTQNFYSSKPPLLPTLVAGEYWLLRHGLGWEIMGEITRWRVVPAILLTFNALPWALFLVLLAGLAERFGATDWGRFLVVAAGCFATFITPFATTLNNHTIAACLVLFALFPAMRIWSWAPEEDTQRRPSPPLYFFILAGFFGALAACNELPALSFAALLFALLFIRAPGRTLLGFVPAAALPAAAFFLTNYLAIGQLIPAYGEFGGPWYNYEGSHWKPATPPYSGIDQAGWIEEKNYGGWANSVYAFHLLLGHHGVFSLTPIFLASVAGMVYGLRGFWVRGNGDENGPLPLVGILVNQSSTQSASFSQSQGLTNLERRGLGMASFLTLVVTPVVFGFFAFYLPKENHTYGGWTCGPRWFLWLIPLWLVTLFPAADWLAQRRWGRVLAYLLLAISVFSVSYPEYNPWRHPWLYNYLEAQGWIKY